MVGERLGYVDPERRRRGIATGLYESLFAVLDEQRLRTAFAGISLPNPASVRFHEAFGFDRIGVYRNAGYKLGGWDDVGRCQRSVRASTSPPAEPIQLTDLQGSHGYRAAVQAGKTSIES